MKISEVEVGTTYACRRRENFVRDVTVISIQENEVEVGENRWPYERRLINPAHLLYRIPAFHENIFSLVRRLVRNVFTRPPSKEIKDRWYDGAHESEEVDEGRYGRSLRS